MACDHVKALNLSKAGKWDEAHRLVQGHSDPMSCRIHAYLHRVEGDLSNARYWYRRAGESVPDTSTEEELSRLYQAVDSARKPETK
jgi:hypothetical protein